MKGVQQYKYGIIIQKGLEASLESFFFKLKSTELLINARSDLSHELYFENN